jgi:hypothetical protein
MKGERMDDNLLGEVPVAWDTYYPQDLEGMFARVVRVERAATDPARLPRRTYRLRSRTPVAIAIASLAGASLVGAGLAAAASSGGRAPGFGHAIRADVPTAIHSFAQRLDLGATTSSHEDPRGSAAGSMTMPTVLGMSEAAAASQLVSAGVDNSQISLSVLSASQTAASGGDAYPSGTVLAQIPGSDDAISGDTAVTLRVTP